MAEKLDRAVLQVKVVPGSSRDKVSGYLGSELKVNVSAPPESGKANAAVVELLAGVLGVGRKSVSVVAGHTRPRKTIEVVGLSQVELGERLKGAGFPIPGN